MASSPAHILDDNQHYGQRPETEIKYRDAVEACSDIFYLQLTISEIALEFKVSPTGLSNQLRTHFPEVLPLREKLRRALGFDNNNPKGPRPQAMLKYSEAVNLLRTSSLSLVEVAERCGVGIGGLRAHVLAHHKEIVEMRRLEREKADCRKLHKGEINPFGKKNEPKPSVVLRFAPAMALYRTTSLSIRSICKRCGISLSGFQQYLYRWHQVDVLRRRGYDLPPDMDQADIPQDLPPMKRYIPAARERYAPVIALLREGASVTEALEKTIGKQHSRVFRAYMQEHEPVLYEEVKHRRQYSTRKKGV